LFPQRWYEVLRSLFGKGKKKGASSPSSQDDNIRAAKVGDVVSISGLRLEYDDVYFFVEKINRYSSETETWYEALCVDGDNQVWIDWTGGYDLTVTATDDPDPVGLGSIGTTEEELIQLDEEHSIDNFIEIEGDKYYYRNSAEVTFYQDSRGQGEGFYNWDLVHEDGEHVLSVSKWEGKPFEATFSEVISPDRIVLYKGDRGDAGKGRK
jgi:hypothetical protein|tara:strand:+ start:479 stop:1105 length:627 start_codon:yes stop_codon:yes gene_type:complete